MADNSQVRQSPRDRALKILTACYDGQRFGQEMLAEFQEADALLPADAALAAELVMGVARHRITAEHLASRFYRGRWIGLRPSIRVIIALGVYQLCWLDRIPDHAAVDQAVRQAKRYGSRTASIVNALLRKLAASRGEVVTEPDDPDLRRYLAIDADRGRLFSENVFPDPARRPLDHIIAVTGHPSWLVERWHRRFKPKLCRQVCDAGGRRPPIVLRPNPMLATADELIARLATAGIDAAKIDGTDAVLVRGPQDITELSEIHEGLCQPQDSTSQIPLRLSPPRPGELVVDLCAGVGTKSTQAAELMKNDGIVIATDTDGWKLNKIPPAAERLGLSIILPTLFAELDAALTRLDRPIDLLLLDVPCSNTGVLARRPEARYRASRKALANLVGIQRDILGRAVQLAGSTTRLIYATCSLEQEENEDQVAWFCAMFDGWRVEQQVFTTPDTDRDGGFAAVLVRI